MSQGKRPGGLTALAVINIIFGSLGIIGSGMNVLMGLQPDMIPRPENPTSEQSQQFEQLDALLNWDLYWPYILVSIVSTILLFVAGIGYLKQKRFLGRTLGNAYAVTSLIAVGMITAGDPMGAGMNWQTIVGIIYPVLTLFLINTTFKDDLVH